MWFFSSPSARAKSSNRPRRHTRRPRLEVLEDRLPLSAGALDPTFGSGAGYVTTALSTPNTANLPVDQGYRVLLQPSGNIVVAGRTSVPSGNSDEIAFGVATYNSDGSLDTAFGSGGIARQVFQPPPPKKKGPPTAVLSEATLYDAALEPTGGTGDAKILLAGGGGGTQPGLGLMRLNSNGSLDTTFGSGGQVITTFPVSVNSNAEIAHGVVVTSTGQIVAVGDNSAQDLLLARYNPNGSLDTSFGTGGEVTTVFSSSAPGFELLTRTVVQQPDGKLVVVGYEHIPVNGTFIDQGVLVRYNADGSLDATFGNGGIVTTVLGAGRSRDQYAAIYPSAGTANDGKIVVVGSLLSGTSGSNLAYQPLVERYNPDGSLDTTFGNGAGYITIGNPVSNNFSAYAVTIESDGKLIVVGAAGNPFLVARLNVDGSLDPTFGNAGLVTTAIGTANSFYGVALQPDGRIVAAGYSLVGGKYDFAVARYLASEPQIGAFTANPNPVTAGSLTTLTASNITDGNPNSTITQVAFYYYGSSGNQVTLGYATQTSPGVWALTSSSAFGLTAGTYTIYAQAEDSYGVFGDPLALTLTVQ
jgi:uncharacterized delta-60 repeat protein